MVAMRQKERLLHLIDTATSLFIEKGYRRTRIAEIASAMGVAPGTVYLYVAGKEALFNLLIRYHFFGLDLDSDLELPLPEPETGGNLKLLQDNLLDLFEFPVLKNALEKETHDSPAAELGAVFDELYDSLGRYRHGLRLIEKSALDWPELADFYYTDLRQWLLDTLREYIEQRNNNGRFIMTGDFEAASRFLLESVARFSMHAHFDRRPDSYSEETGRRTVRELIVNGFCGKGD